MTTLELRNKIHKYIDEADDRILNIIHAIVSSEEQEEFVLSEELKNTLDQRLKEHEENPNEGKSWEKVQAELKLKYEL